MAIDEQKVEEGALGGPGHERIDVSRRGALRR